MKIIASRISEGNKIFPAEIHVETTGVTIKIPGLFSGESKHFDFQHIASVDIETPLIGYSTITIYAGGTQMSAHGFTKSEVKQVKEAIESSKNASKRSNKKEVLSKEPSFDNSKLSIADELIKMKELVDLEVITQEDFDDFKKKILNKL